MYRVYCNDLSLSIFHYVVLMLSNQNRSWLAIAASLFPQIQCQNIFVEHVKHSSCTQQILTTLAEE